MTSSGGRPAAGIGVWRLALLAACFPVVHALIYPYAVYLHPDTTGLVIAGEALADEGRLVQPFRWDYIFEVSGKDIVSDDQPIVSLDHDARVGGVIYPPGYSWIVAAGRLAGLSTSQTCWGAFYAALGLSAFCWLWWGQRSGVPLSSVCVGLLTLLAIGPATVTDPFGWLAAAVILLIVTFEFRLALIVLATIVMIWADLIRHAAILAGAAWFWLWMTRRITVGQRLWVCVSCAVIVVVDFLAKYLRTGGLDPMSMFQGGWPDSTEAVRAVYYAVLGGWSPNAAVLKVLVGLLAGLGLVGLLIRPRTALQQRWICDLVILQGATAFVLCIAQYKYGADFTKAPVAIARYWRYCAPGLVCAHLFGLGLLVGRYSGSSPRWRTLMMSAYAIVVVAAVALSVVENRERWSANVVGHDGFGRRSTTAEVHQLLQSDSQLTAVLTDNHQLVFTAVDPQQIHCIYYQSGFVSEAGGRIAVVTSQTDRGQNVVDVCESLLTRVAAEDVSESVSVRTYELPPGQVIEFDPKELAVGDGSRGREDSARQSDSVRSSTRATGD